MTYTINSKIVIGKSVYNVVAVEDVSNRPALAKEGFSQMMIATKGNKTYMINQLTNGQLTKPYSI